MRIRVKTATAVKIAAVMAVMAVLLTACGSNGAQRAKPEAITDVAAGERGLTTCMYDGMQRSFLECVPEDPAGVTGIAVLLHGADMSAESFEMETMFEEDAGPKGYVVVYVNGVSNPEKATGRSGWNGGLESNPVDDSGFLRSLAIYMQEKYGLTKEQTFLAGFSNGAVMTMRMAVEGDDCYTAAASVCGRMPHAIWDSRAKKANISVLQITGGRDDATPTNANGTAKYSIDPAIEDVMLYFADSMKLEEETSTQITKQANLIKRFSPKSPHQVWHVFISDGHHGWQHEKTSGFDANDVVLDFFEAVREGK